MARWQMAAAHYAGFTLALSSALALCSGCALTSKAQPLSPRYFSPEPSESEQVPVAGRGPELELRLGEVEAASQLEERMAYRSSELELGYKESWRWTEPPRAYVRRALLRELFERRGLTRVVSGPAPTLDVELSSFEEIRGQPPRARVELWISLSGARHALLERSVRVEQPLASATAQDEPLRLTAALSLALGDAVARVGELVTAELAELPRNGAGSSRP
jgi:hypothetical protein